MRVLDALATVAGRISTGSAMAVAIAAGLWHGHTGEVDPVRLGAVVTTTLAWLAAEIASGRKPSEHDLALFKRIIELLPEGTTDLIRNHDFHNSFHGHHQDGLFELAAWEGARYQFLDSVLQRRWAAVHAQIGRLTKELVTAVGPVGAGPLFTAHPQIGDRDNPEPWVQDRIDTLNREASATSKIIDAFERFARNRLRL
jgi:hypothetical protein